MKSTTRRILGKVLAAAMLLLGCASVASAPAVSGELQKFRAARR